MTTILTPRAVKGSVFSVAEGSNLVSFDIRIAVNDIRQMLHNIHDAVAERGSEVGDIGKCLMCNRPDIILREQCFRGCPCKVSKQLPAPGIGQFTVDVTCDHQHTAPKSSHRNRKLHPMSIPGSLGQPPDGFGVVDAGIGDVERLAFDKADLVTKIFRSY